MKPEDLYKREPESVSYDLNPLGGCYYNFLPEITHNWDWGWVDPEKYVNERVEIRIYKHFDFDGRRFWRLAGVFFDGKPVMITQNAGREGDDHNKRFITDHELYREMIVYIQSLLPPEDDKSLDDTYEMDQDLDDLDNFYGNSLDGYFGRY